MHAVIQIGDSYLMMGDEMSEKCVSAETLGRTPITMFLYVQDADASYTQAVAAGAKPDVPWVVRIAASRCSPPRPTGRIVGMAPETRADAANGKSCRNAAHEWSTTPRSNAYERTASRACSRSDGAWSGIDMVRPFA